MLPDQHWPCSDPKKAQASREGGDRLRHLTPAYTQCCPAPAPAPAPAQEWRVRAMLPARQTVLLDANDGEGWDLAEALLRPREVSTHPCSAMLCAKRPASVPSLQRL